MKNMNNMKIRTSPTTSSENLHALSFLQGNTRALFDSNPVDSPDWSAFAQSWNDLPQDEYMGDGGKYRYRRFSEFLIGQESRSLSVLSHGPYRQSKEDNYLNGEIDRLYSPMQEEIQQNQAFRQVLLSFADVMKPLCPSANWFVQVFQNRIVANGESPGMPTPEGVHRDGVDFVLTLLINRHNVDGGASSTFAQDGRTLVASTTLTEAGDFIFLNDKLMKHSVQPISRLAPVEDGYRDALIVMYTQRIAVGA
jgi:hypothetical protein